MGLASLHSSAARAWKSGMSPARRPIALDSATPRPIRSRPGCVCLGETASVPVDELLAARCGRIAGFVDAAASDRTADVAARGGWRRRLRRFKVKAGGTTVDNDLARTAVSRRPLPRPAHPADSNQGFARKKLCCCRRALGLARLHLAAVKWNDLDALRRCRRDAAGLFDEVLHSLDDIEPTTPGRARSARLRPNKLGGLSAVMSAAAVRWRSACSEPCRSNADSSVAACIVHPSAPRAAARWE